MLSNMPSVSAATLRVKGYKGLWLTMAFAAAVMLLPARADATLVLNLDGYSGAPAGGVTCVDNDATCDDDATVGLISYSDTSLGNWTVNVQVGYSNAPGDDSAILHLSSVLLADGADTLTMTITDFFSSPTDVGVLSYSMGGSGDVGDGTYLGYAIKFNEDLQYFTQTPDCQSSLVFSPFGCGPVTANHPAYPGGYFMTLYQTISVPGATGFFSLDTDVTNTGSVPEPVTLTLFGLGLAGVAGAVRRRRQQAGSAK